MTVDNKGNDCHQEGLITTLPVIAVITFITVIGLPIGIILLFSYIMLILLATVITSVVAASWLNNPGNLKQKFWRIAFSAPGIFILLKILTFTPFLGWLIMMVLAFISFGSILLNINWRGKNSHQPAA